MKAVVWVAVVLGLVGCAGEPAEAPPTPEYQSCRCSAPSPTPGQFPIVGESRLFCWRSDKPGLSETLTAYVNQRSSVPGGRTEPGNSTCMCTEAVGRDCGCNNADGALTGEQDTALCQAR